MSIKDNIILLKSAQKDLDQLAPPVLSQVLKVFDRLAYHPNLAKPLAGILKGVYSYRFGTPSGEFRIAFLRENNNNKIIVLAIGPRRSFYQILGRRI